MNQVKLKNSSSSSVIYNESCPNNFKDTTLLRSTFNYLITVWINQMIEEK